MGVTAGEFDALVEDLVATLNAFNVPAAEQQELLGILGPLRSDIVEIESARPARRFPESYQPAAPCPRSRSSPRPRAAAHAHGRRTMAK